MTELTSSIRIVFLFTVLPLIIIGICMFIFIDYIDIFPYVVFPVVLVGVSLCIRDFIKNEDGLFRFRIIKILVGIDN